MNRSILKHSPFVCVAALGLFPLAGCSSSSNNPAPSQPPFDAGTFESGASDGSVNSDTGTQADGASDAPTDGQTRSYNCGAFTENPGWTVQPGFHAVVVADANDGLNQPVALAFARGAFGNNRLFVVDQGDKVLRAVDVDTGATTTVVAADAWPSTPGTITSITWDSENLFDGNLYVADQGSNSDGDSKIFRVNAQGQAAAFAAAPGAAMDDVFTLVFVNGNGYSTGLYISGDTDGSGPDWGRIDAQGNSVAFSEVAGSEGAVFDRSGAYGNKLITSRPLGGGYAGDGTIVPLDATGAAGNALATDLGGVHALALSTGGAFANSLYAASWSTGKVLRISPTGTVDEVASGLQLTNYDGNILAFSPDGNVLYIADREAKRIVCIEPE